MPATTRSATVATADELAAAAGITTDTGYQLVDRYGVTYTGTPAHLTLAALARADLTPGLYRDERSLRAAVRASARWLALWFTSPYVAPEHATTFAELSPRRVCELVTHVVNRSHDALSQIGPSSLLFYTAYLTSGAVDDPESSFPNVVDNPYRSLKPDLDDGLRLDITATAPDGTDEVKIRMKVEARESISWDFVTAIPVPVDEINDLLMEPNWAPGRWLDDNSDFIFPHLDYCNSSSEHGIDIDARVVPPDTPRTYPDLEEPSEPAEPASRADVAVYFVGSDQDTAVSTSPFLDLGEATTIANAHGHQVFTAEVSITAVQLQTAGPVTTAAKPL